MAELTWVVGLYKDSLPVCSHCQSVTYMISTCLVTATQLGIEPLDHKSEDPLLLLHTLPAHYNVFM